MTSEICFVLTSCPDESSAGELAERLLERRLAACVSRLPAVVSLYEWQGRREQANEVLVLIKTRAPLYEAVEDCIREGHPYELPEIVMVSIDRALPAYRAWIEQTTTEQPTR